MCICHIFVFQSGRVRMLHPLMIYGLFGWLSFYIVILSSFQQPLYLMLILQKLKILLKICNKKRWQKRRGKNLAQMSFRCLLWGTMSQLDDNYDKYGRVWFRSNIDPRKAYIDTRIVSRNKYLGELFLIIPLWLSYCGWFVNIF